MSVGVLARLEIRLVYDRPRALISIWEAGAPDGIGGVGGTVVEALRNAADRIEREATGEADERLRDRWQRESVEGQ